MKNSIVKCTLAILLCAISSSIFSQNVGINTTGSTPSTNAILDLNTGNAKNLGLLIPRVVLGSSLSTFSPPMVGANTGEDSGMMVYNWLSTNQPVGYYYWSGSTWVYASGGLGTANNGLSLSGTTVQLGDAATATFPTGNQFITNGRVVTQNGLPMTFDLNLNTAATTTTGSFLIQNGTSYPYFYAVPSTSASNGPTIGIGNSSPGSNILNVSISTNNSGTGNGINLQAQGGTTGGAVQIAAGSSTSTGSGGNVTIAASGAGTTGTGTAGKVTIAAGQGAGSVSGTGGSGGNVNITTGNANGSGNNNGGNAIITTGTSTGTGSSGGVAINTTGTAPNSSALLDMNTGNTFSSGNGKGVLIPNVALSSSTDASTIKSPATSLMVYVPSGSGLTPAGFYYNSGTPGSPVWTQVVTGTNTTTIFDHCTTVVNSTSTGFVEISLPGNSVCGGMVNLCIYATNGTDYQSYTNTLHFAAANKGGTYTTKTAVEPDAETTATSTGTLTTSYSITNGTNMITLDIDASSNLTGAVTVQACYIIFEYSGKTITEL